MDMLNSLPDDSRVWVYQSSRHLSEEEVEQINDRVGLFAQQWTAHNMALRAAGAVLHSRFLVLAVDETQAGASGCSIDKSLHFVKALERDYATQLLDRMTFAWLDGGEVVTAPVAEFADRYRQQQLNDETPVFDNLVATLGGMRREWKKPLGQSWHKRFV